MISGKKQKLIIFISTLHYSRNKRPDMSNIALTRTKNNNNNNRIMCKEKKGYLHYTVKQHEHLVI